LNYSEFEFDDDGIEWLLDPIVQAATVVNNPAYEGRTDILSVASKQHTDLPDSSFAFIEPGGETEKGMTHPRSLRHFPYKDAEGKISETLLNESLVEIDTIQFDQKEAVLLVLNDAKAELEKEKQKSMTEERIKELETESASLRDKISELEQTLEELKTEREELQTYKEKREKEDADAELLKTRISALTEAGFEFDEEQVASKRGFWLAMDEDTFTTYVEDRKSVKESQADSLPNTPVPDLSSQAASDKEFKKALREALDGKEERQ
jgi:myosin heavy subunit